jgi:hypothetical protein
VTKRAWITLLGCALLAACTPAGPVRRFEKGEELVFNDFSQPNTFEHGSFEGARLQITDGVYRITVTEGDSTFWWGQWGDIYENVVIDVDVNQLSERNDNMYGVMCRVRGAVGLPVTPDPELQAIMSAGQDIAEAGLEEADVVEVTEEAEATEVTAEEEATEEATEVVDEATEEAATEAATEAADEATEEPAESTEEAVEDEATAEATDAADASTMVNNGDGYLFLIRGDGAYAIMRSRGRDVQALVDWKTSNAINQGPGQNHLRVVCVDDYLALYVNDQFVADAIDDTYTRGQVGLAAAAVDRLGVQVEFDNLSISQANPA